MRFPAALALISGTLATIGACSTSPKAPAVGPETGAGGSSPSAMPTEPIGQTVQGFLKARGTELVDASDSPVLLRGAAFGNNIWAGQSAPPQFHHDARDFARLRAMGMNSARFYLNYQLFESDDAPYQYRDAGFDWIDQNIAWAKAEGVVLLLNMHFPQGGFQSNGDGDALWEVEDNQKRFIALWRAIAERYAEEPSIAGFDLLNEPRPTETQEQWQALANKTAHAIREVDTKHLIVVERPLAVAGDFSVDENQNFFLIDDANALYEFHFYSPIEYTHQYAEWIGFGDGGKYPDESVVSGANLSWSDWNHTPSPPPYLPAGTSEFSEFESDRYAIPAGVAVVQPVLASELNQGSAYFDELVVKEYDPSGTFVRNVIEEPLDSISGWDFWQEAPSAGTATLASSSECHSGSCIVISGTSHDANLNNPKLRFVPKADHTYSVGGWMRGVDISDDSRPDPRGAWTQVSRALFRLDYFTADGAVTSRNRQSLENELSPIVAWGKANSVPLYLGEFGVIYHCFDGDKGGLTWVGDMLDLSLEAGLSFSYHSYHEHSFPIFQGDPTRKLPEDSDAVPGLRELFRKKLSD